MLCSPILSIGTRAQFLVSLGPELTGRACAFSDGVLWRALFARSQHCILHEPLLNLEHSAAGHKPEPYTFSKSSDQNDVSSVSTGAHSNKLILLGITRHPAIRLDPHGEITSGPPSHLDCHALRVFCKQCNQQDPMSALSSRKYLACLPSLFQLD